jgi:hypothetical protein
MCPVCIATAVWIAAGVGSTGGVSALVVSSLRGKSQEATANNENDGNGARYDADKY